MIVANDLEALIQFRNHLVDFNRTLQDEYARMNAHLHEIGGVWHDAMYDRLCDGLNEVNRGIERYLAATDEHETYLLGRIEALGEYLQR